MAIAPYKKPGHDFRPGAALNYHHLYTNHVTAVYLREVVFCGNFALQKSFCLARASAAILKKQKTISRKRNQPKKRQPKNGLQLHRRSRRVYQQKGVFGYVVCGLSQRSSADFTNEAVMVRHRVDAQYCHTTRAVGVHCHVLRPSPLVL